MLEAIASVRCKCQMQMSKTSARGKCQAKASDRSTRGKCKREVTEGSVRGKCQTEVSEGSVLMTDRSTETHEKKKRADISRVWGRDSAVNKNLGICQYSFVIIHNLPKCGEKIG